MPQPGRAAALALGLPAAAILLLAGCDSRARRAAELEAASRAAAPRAGSSFVRSTADARVELQLPPGLDGYPELHRTLYDEGRRELEDFARVAAEDRRNAAAKGVPVRGPYQRKVVWTVSAVTPGLVSLRAAWFADTGGAHPNHGTETRLWDRTRNQMLSGSDLFRPGYDPAPLDAALCQAVTRVKEARMGKTDPASWTCPKWADSRFVLVPSSARRYRAGGLAFLFDPYVIGAYAEGDYEAVVPLAAFGSALAPEWAAQFAGSPAAPPAGAAR